MYTKRTLDSYFFKTNGFYIFHIPVNVPYKKIYVLADAAGVKKKEDFGPILESSKMFGSGWIGIEVDASAKSHADVIHIQGEFNQYEHKGPYRTINQGCNKITKENPGAKVYYHIYLDDPDKLKPEDCRTQLLFK